MAGTRSTDRIAPYALAAVVVALGLGIFGTFGKANSALASAEADAITGARALSAHISTIVTPEDLDGTMGTARSKQISDRILSAIAGTPTDAVTIWSTDGVALLSTEGSISGTAGAAQREAIRIAIRDGATKLISGNVFSSTVALQPQEALEPIAVVEVDRAYKPIHSTAVSTWRIAAVGLAVALALTIGMFFRTISRLRSSAAANRAFTRPLRERAQDPTPAPKSAKRSPDYLSPDFHAEAEAREAAEKRALAAEERASALQEQYRTTLEELQETRRELEGASPETPSRPDPEIEERLLKAEGRVRLLEGQLQATKTERDRLGLAMQEPAKTTPDPETERALRRVEQESIGLRAELEGARTELNAATKQRDAVRAEVENMRTEMVDLRAKEQRAAELEAALTSTKAEFQKAKAESEMLRTLVDEIKSAAKSALEEAKANAAAELATARAEAIAEVDEARVTMATLQSALDEVRAAAAAEVEETKASISTQMQAALDAAQAELASARAELARIESSAGENVTLAETQAAQAIAEAQARADAVAAEAEAALQAAISEAKTEAHAEIEATKATGRAKLKALEDELREQMLAREEELRATFAAEQAALMVEMQADIAAARAETEQAMAALATATEELQAVKTEAESRQGDVGTIRAEIKAVQAQLASAEQNHEDTRVELAAALTELGVAHADLQSARDLIAELQAGMEDSTRGTAEEMAAARDEARRLQVQLEQTQVKLDQTEASLEETQTRLAAAEAGVSSELRSEIERQAELAARADAAEAELASALKSATAAQADASDLRARSEEAERQIEHLMLQHANATADSEERADLEEVLRLTQERLASNTDRLAEMEERTHAAEAQLQASLEKVEELESAVRVAEMEKAAAVLHIAPAMDDDLAAATQAAMAEGQAAILEDRRAAAPFMKELAMDAKKQLTSILGLTLTLKHKKAPNEQAPLLRQLAAMARRLDHTVADLVEADQLARGTIELRVRRTNLEALMHRVIEESQVSSEHDIRVETEELIISVDPVRTEQIIAGLLRGAVDRTPPGSAITVRMGHTKGGALISVEDMETSSDASLSPVVARFADVQGGWAKVEGRPNGGSAFRVFLPDRVAEALDGDLVEGPGVDEADGADRPERLAVTSNDGTEIVVDSVEEEPYDPWEAGRLLVQELHQLSRDD